MVCGRFAILVEDSAFGAWESGAFLEFSRVGLAGEDLQLRVESDNVNCLTVHAGDVTDEFLGGLGEGLKQKLIGFKMYGGYPLCQDKCTAGAIAGFFQDCGNLHELSYVDLPTEADEPEWDVILPAIGSLRNLTELRMKFGYAPFFFRALPDSGGPLAYLTQLRKLELPLSCVEELSELLPVAPFLEELVIPVSEHSFDTSPEDIITWNAFLRPGWVSGHYNQLVGIR